MRRVEIIGHRGARGLFPENTIEGFRAAHALGVRSFELDVGMTADGVVVVSHDPALKPRHCQGFVRTVAERAWSADPRLTFETLQSYDVGRIRPASRYRWRTALRPMRRRPHSVAARGSGLSPNATFIIELKTDPRHPDWTADPATLADAVLVWSTQPMRRSAWFWNPSTGAAGPYQALAAELPARVADADETTATRSLVGRRDAGGFRQLRSAAVAPKWAGRGSDLGRRLGRIDPRSGRRSAWFRAVRDPWTVNRRAAMRRSDRLGGGWPDHRQAGQSDGGAVSLGCSAWG